MNSTPNPMTPSECQAWAAAFRLWWWATRATCRVAARPRTPAHGRARRLFRGDRRATRGRQSATSDAFVQKSLPPLLQYCRGSVFIVSRLVEQHAATALEAT